MNPRNVIIIPPTLQNQASRYLGTPGKTHVVGYARVEKGNGAGVQIRKKNQTTHRRMSVSALRGMRD